MPLIPAKPNSHPCPLAARPVGLAICLLPYPMSAPTSPTAARLASASQQLYEQLRQLEAGSQQPAQPLALGGLLAAFDDYERAVLAGLPPVLAWQDNPNPTPAELLTEREQSPLYQLGWVRGYKAGQAASQRPAPIDLEALMRQVRCLLAELQQRYGGPITQGQYSPSLNHFRSYAAH